MNTSKQLAVAALALGAATGVHAQPTADDIARSIVIGQAYTSGNVYVGGFVDDAARDWPRRLNLTALRTPDSQRIGAAFVRVVPPDSDEQYYFPQREDGGSAGPDDLFSTIDGMALADPNLARYRASTRIAMPVAIIGWDEGLALSDITFAGKDQLRPTTAAERAAIAAEKRAVPKDVECATEPAYLDAAKVILTASIAQSTISIRLSRFDTPGCAGHLSEIYVLDVVEPGRDPRRFEFRHYVGLL